MGDNGHIFVIDANHNCIRLFTINGEYRSGLMKKGQYGITICKWSNVARKHPLSSSINWENVQQYSLYVMCDQDGLLSL